MGRTKENKIDDDTMLLFISPEVSKSHPRVKELLCVPNIVLQLLNERIVNIGYINNDSLNLDHICSSVQIRMRNASCQRFCSNFDICLFFKKFVLRWPIDLRLI